MENPADCEVVVEVLEGKEHASEGEDLLLMNWRTTDPSILCQETDETYVTKEVSV